MNFMVWRGAQVLGASEAGDYHPKLRSDDTTQPFNAILIKALDCAMDDYPVWQGNFDAGSPHSAAELAQQLTSYRLQGLDAIPWGVSRGTFPYDEGRMAGEAAQQDPEGRFCLDLEPYDMFWQNHDPQSARDWLRGFTENGGRELWISTDSRGTKPIEVHLPVWLENPVVTRIMPQSYWTDFQQDWKTGVDASYEPLLALGVSLDRIHVTYPLNATATDLQQAIQYATAFPPFGGVNFWRRGIATQQLLDGMAGWDQPVFGEPAPPTPEPLPLPPTVPPEEAYRAGLAQGFRDVILYAQERLNSL